METCGCNGLTSLAGGLPRYSPGEASKTDFSYLTGSLYPLPDVGAE